MSKVTSIRGQPIPTPGEPVDAVVAQLRDLLAEAEAGVLKGIAGVGLYSDNSTHSFERGDTGWDVLRGALFRVLQGLG